MPDPGELAEICRNPLLPAACFICGACGDDAHVPELHDAHHAHHPQLELEHRLAQHVHLGRADIARFTEDPDDRPYIWDLTEENCSCH